VSWSRAPLSELSQTIDYGVTASANFEEGKAKFLRITDIQDNSVNWATVPFCDAPDKKLAHATLRNGDIVFARTGATTGKSFLLKNPPSSAVFASYLIRVRPSERVDPGYLAHFFDTSDYWRQIKSKAQGAAQEGVNASKLATLEIPLPPLDEQKRIAAILDKADQLRQKRRQAIALLDSLTQSIFLEMFGDPVSNPKAWNRQALADVADFTSGGTPSKSSPSFWVGQIPWVSPKDMKSVAINDAIDHISEIALQHSATKIAPKNSVLMVVRGMILAHTVPIAILSRECAFNQDIKAIQFDGRIDPIFGLWNLLSQRSAILQEVSSAAHGTKRLDTGVISTIPVLCPPLDLQRQFANRYKLIVRSLEGFSEAALRGDIFFKSLQSTLFSAGSSVQ